MNQIPKDLNSQKFLFGTVFDFMTYVTRHELGFLPACRERALRGIEAVGWSA